MPTALFDLEALKAYYLKQLEANGWQSRIAGADNTARILDALVAVRRRPRMGLLIGGQPGIGKTCLLKAIRSFCGQPQKFLSLGHTDMIVLSEAYQENVGENLLQHYLFLDDIGAELTTSEYGRLEEPVARFLTRYEELGEKRIFATTNLTFEEVAERYGARVASRLKSLFVPLRLLGKDKRQWTLDTTTNH